MVIMLINYYLFCRLRRILLSGRIVLSQSCCKYCSRDFRDRSDGKSINTLSHLEFLAYGSKRERCGSTLDNLLLKMCNLHHLTHTFYNFLRVSSFWSTLSLPPDRVERGRSRQKGAAIFHSEV